MTDLSFDWLFLFLQIAVLGWMIVRELARPRGRNIFAILVPLTFLVLVQAQAAWTFREFANTHDTVVDQLYNSISLPMAQRANLYIGFGIAAYVIAFAVGSRHRVFRSPEPIASTREPIPRLSYAFVGGWTIGAATLLIGTVGGLLIALTRPGQLIDGQTVFIIALGMGKWPLIDKVARKQRLNTADVVLWTLATLLTLFNSRFLTTFALLQLVIVIHYCRREVSRRLLFSMAIPAVSIFIGFGLYRDFAFRFGTVGGKEAVNEFLSRPDEWNVGDWFYRTNVEGFTGLAGALTYQSSGHVFDYDLGTSELAVFTKLVPNAIRNAPGSAFFTFAQTVQQAYPFSDSVVPSGFELAYGHLGLGGILIYGAILGWLTAAFHRRAANANAFRFYALLLSVQMLNGVRGSIFFALVFFGLGDLFTFWVYRGSVLTARTLLGSAPRPLTAENAPT